MDKIFMIHLDDYIRHIDDKLMLYAMLRQMEAVISKLPDCRAVKQVREQMAAFSPKVEELWDGWNIPKRYLVSGELGDLHDVMDEELMEPEDAGYYCTGSYEDTEPAPVPELTDHALLLALMDTADQLYDNYAALIALAQKQLRRCQQ